MWGPQWEVCNLLRALTWPCWHRYITLLVFRAARHNVCSYYAASLRNFVTVAQTDENLPQTRRANKISENTSWVLLWFLFFLLFFLHHHHHFLTSSVRGCSVGWASCLPPAHLQCSWDFQKVSIYKNSLELFFSITLYYPFYTFSYLQNSHSLQPFSENLLTLRPFHCHQKPLIAILGVIYASSWPCQRKKTETLDSPVIIFLCP